MHGLLAVGYQHRSELLVRDRDWAHKDYLTNPQGGWSAAGNPSSYIATGVVAPSAANPLGIASPVPIRDPQCDDLGGFPGRVASGASVCYWQYSPGPMRTRSCESTSVCRSCPFEMCTTRPPAIERKAFVAPA